MTEYLYKVLVVGNNRVGKTAFLERYINNSFSAQYKTTLGVDFQPKVIKYEYCTLRMQFWDIAGQDRVKVLTRNYYNGASACLIVFDITNSKSFEDVKEWKAEIDDKLGQIPTIVLANKQDLVDDISDPKKACVDDMDLDNLKDEIKATEVFHVSAKTGYQVKDSMQLLEKILMGVTIPRTSKGETSDKSIILDKTKTEPHYSRSCCLSFN
ncbi:hypothetical protein ACHWQZ_G011038 [Mnemiopsis leidyi]